MILTADEFVRGGETRPLKIHVDDALESILEERKLAKEIRIAKNRATGDQQPLVDNFKDDHEFVVLIAKRTGKQIPIIQINGAREKLLEVVILYSVTVMVKYISVTGIKTTNRLAISVCI